MEFYVIIVPPLILSVLMVIHLHKMGRQDSLLFAQRQKLRKLMVPILESNLALSKERYYFFRIHVESESLPKTLSSNIEELSSVGMKVEVQKTPALWVKQDEIKDAADLTAIPHAHRTK